MIRPEDLQTPESGEPLTTRQALPRRTTLGRPCPAIVEGLQCNGNSEVVKVRHVPEKGIRWRRCLSCGHRWRTKEINEE